MYSSLDEAHWVARMSSCPSPPSSHSRKKGQVWQEGSGKCENLTIINADLCKSVGVIIDVAESSPKRFKCSPQPRKSQKFTFQDTIKIEDENEGSDNRLRNGDEGGDLIVNGTSSKKSHPPVNQSNNFDELGRHHHQMHPCNGSSRNHFGLYADTECSSSQSDVSDFSFNEDSISECEKDQEEAALRRKVLEDIRNSSCEILEQREEAALRKKVLEDINNYQCGLDDHGIAFGLDTDYIREDIPLRSKVLADIHNCHSELHNHSRNFRPDADSVNPSTEYAQKKINTWNSIDSKYCCMEEHSPSKDTVQYVSGNPIGDKESSATFSPTSKYKGENLAADGCLTVDDVIEKSTSHLNIEVVHLEKLFMHGTQYEIQVNDDSMILKDSKESVYEEPSLCCNQLLAETMTNNGGDFHVKEAGFEESSMCSVGPQNERSTCYPVNCSRIIVEKPLVPNNLLIGREKFKETDEYKCALDIEWASRLQQLEIQAKEAQLLKKRKKSEKLRLLDMERRQKQRLEEMWESLKKDEETMTLKEKLRVNFRRKLDKLELQHQDMASLLRGLGIHVKAGCHPESHQVNSAYRQALLRFHPDRVSRSDIHQQVEAEEIFKLLSHLKEKHFPKA